MVHTAHPVVLVALLLLSSFPSCVVDLYSQKDEFRPLYLDNAATTPMVSCSGTMQYRLVMPDIRVRVCQCGNVWCSQLTADIHSQIHNRPLFVWKTGKAGFRV